MEDNLKKILQEFENLKGQHVIVGYFEIERLIAIGDDGEDYYYLTWNGKSEKLRWNSCVGSIIPLKGYLRDSDYDILISIAKLNHWDYIITNKDVVEIYRLDMLDLKNNDKLLSEPCWELN
jgi:hypothetical protein